MTLRLPEGLRDSRLTGRLEAAVHAVSSAGVALLRLRGSRLQTRECGTQLKTAVDLAAEGWVAGYLEGSYPSDHFLCEERFGHDPSGWRGSRSFWTVDALDGTRSYVEGFDGFCVQVAFVSEGTPQLAAIMEPVRDKCFVAIAGRGAYRLSLPGGERLSRLSEEELGRPRFVDSTPPDGAAGEIMRRLRGRFIEHGSVGLKLCRIAEGSGEVVLKRFAHKVWDVAPGDCLLREVGGFVADWRGRPVPYDGSTVHLAELLASRVSWRDALVARIAEVAA
ncbi:MAG: inositol monophosphatase family protein [Gemmatimonadota bacterium]